MSLKKPMIIGVVLIVFAAVTLGYQLLRFQYQPIHLSQETQIFSIQPGFGIKSIAQQLGAEKIIEDPWLLILMARIKGVDAEIKAGEYQLQNGQSSGDMLDLFVKGVPIQHAFTIIEGWTFRQMLAEMEKSPVLKHSLKGQSDAEIMSSLGYQGQHPEGLFFPDTYHFPKGTKDIALLRRAHQLMQQHLQHEWENRASGLPFTSPYEALILASIIEKETGAAFERALIAGVFIQRLKRKMRLQTDPTVIYGMGDDFHGNIRHRDLKKDTPYNTYLRPGLTPTPIALPGLAAIQAALHPADTRALFFVAKGGGTHQFSETIEEHNNAVAKYQLKKPRQSAGSGN